ncbi:MAG: hypothetical protein PVJ78_05115, partial [Gammaproteobacteria bacterium]
FPQKLDIPGSPGDQLSERYPNLERLTIAISKIRVAQRPRNKFVHDSLVSSEDGDYLELPVATARGKLKTDVQKVKLTHSKRTTVGISTARRALYKVVFQKDLPPPWNGSAYQAHAVGPNARYACIWPLMRGVT